MTMAALDRVIHDAYGEAIVEQINSGDELIRLMRRERYDSEVARLGHVLDGWI